MVADAWRGNETMRLCWKSFCWKSLGLLLSLIPYNDVVSEFLWLVVLRGRGCGELLMILVEVESQDKVTLE